MKRGAWIVLVLSLALNIGFVSAALVHWTDAHRGGSYAGRGYGQGRDDDGSRRGSGHRGRFNRDGQGGRMGRHMSRMQGPRPDLFDHWPERRIQHLNHEVNLSEEQKQLLRERLGELRDAIRANAEELREERMRLRRALVQGDAGAAAVRGGARRVADLQARLDSLVAESIIRENSVLTPEQRESYRDLEWGPMEDAGPPPVAP